MKNNLISHSFKIIPLLFLSNLLLANEPVKAVKNAPDIMDWVFNNLLLVIGGIVIIGALAAIFNLFNKLLEIQKIRILEANGLVTADNVAAVEGESWWSRMSEKLTKVVPVEEEKSIIMHHEYDGIRELDNVLPPWWVATFYASVIAGFLYIGYWHFSDYGYSQAEEYKREIVTAEASVKAYLASQSNRVDETNVELLIDDTQLAIGGAIFSGKCIACHGQAGEGNTIGPNLTDEYWLHGGDVKDVFKTIKYGVPEKGMISWKSQMRPAEMQKVASYILSLQGSNPPNAKAPQGELYTPQEKEEETDGKIGMK